MTSIPDGVPIRFALGKRHGVEQEVAADFEENADFCGLGFHIKQILPLETSVELDNA